MSGNASATSSATALPIFFLVSASILRFLNDSAFKIGTFTLSARIPTTSADDAAKPPQ